MQVVHALLTFLDILVALALVFMVTSQTSKDQGMGGTLGGGGADAGAGNTRYKGGVEEMVDMWTARLAYTFLVLSFIVAALGRYIARGA